MNPMLPRLLILILPWMVSCQKAGIQEVPGRPSVTAVIGGSAAEINEFPFAVNIWLNTPEENYVAPLCGGSLIAKNWVLTAAHCVLEDDSESTQRTLKSSQLKMYIGGIDISGKDGRLLKAKRILVHPDFSWPFHDVALIELAESVLDVEPVKLNTEVLGVKANPGIATVLGWGLTDPKGKVLALTLQKVNMPLISNTACAQDDFPKSRHWSLGPEILCAQTSHHQKTSCPGDSGGPLVRTLNGSYTQVGIVSWGSGCSETPASQASNVAGFADVSAAYPWIKQYID